MSPAEQAQNPAQAPVLTELSIQILHDNNPYADALQTAWGFSALVRGPEKTILFDTGSDGTLLLENMAKLQIEPGKIDVVVLSHLHADHTGGLTGFLRVNPRVGVRLPASFPTRFKEAVRGYGADVAEVEGPQEICPNVYTTGVLGRRIKEQALILCTERGLVVLTGCAHPGIVPILTKVRGLSEEDILLVIGGFHLEWATRWKVQTIIGAFRDYGIRYVAPTHCSGDKARQLFQHHYDRSYIDIGVGKIVTLADLR